MTLLQPLNQPPKITVYQDSLFWPEAHYRARAGIRVFSLLGSHYLGMIQ